MSACSRSRCCFCVFVPQMIVTDIYNHRFHRIFATNENLSSIMERDDIYVLVSR